MTRIAFPYTVEALLADSTAFQDVRLTDSERALISTHLDGRVARVRSGEALEVSVEDAVVAVVLTRGDPQSADHGLCVLPLARHHRDWHCDTEGRLWPVEERDPESVGTRQWAA